MVLAQACVAPLVDRDILSGAAKLGFQKNK
jgi:hypothetical protein